MNKEVTVKITAEISSDQDTEKIDTSYKGCFFDKNDYRYVLYDEDTESGSVNKCRLKISDSAVEIRKKGECTSTMTFCRGTSSKTSYVTPFGIFDLEVDTNRLDIFISPEKIKIRLQYDMLTGGYQKTGHKMDIVIS